MHVLRQRLSCTWLLNPYPHEDHEDYESIHISLLLYLGFVGTPIVNIHIVIFWVKTPFSQLGGEVGGTMFFRNVGRLHVLDQTVI
jgi:hypothetical protein